MKTLKDVGYGCLAPLLVLDKEMEPIPDPFRMQKNVAFIVSFSEYVKFIDYSLGRVDYLATPTRLLKSYRAKHDNDSLYAAYLRDIAFSVAKELHYAETYKKEAAMIVHEKYGAEEIPYTDIERMFKDTHALTENRLRSYMSSHNFPLPISFRDCNQSYWQYANVLLFFSIAPGNSWCFNRKELMTL